MKFKLDHADKGIKAIVIDPRHPTKCSSCTELLIIFVDFIYTEARRKFSRSIPADSATSSDGPIKDASQSNISN